MGPAEGAQRLIKDIESISKRKICIALSGGRSAAAFYPHIKRWLHSQSQKELVIFLLDERICRRRRNSPEIKKSLDIEKSSGTKRKVLFYELGSGKAQDLLNKYNKKFEAECKGFDIIIAGVGEDGHIASLFPGSGLIKSKHKGYLLVKDSPKPPRTRITASPKLISSARFRYLLFIGREKKKAYADFVGREKNEYSCPAKLAAGKSAKNLRVIAKFN